MFENEAKRQPILQNPISSPLQAAAYRPTRDVVEVARLEDIAYLASELNVSGLNEIHGWLWVVGLPIPPRALHLQKIKSREIMVTERMELHLLWTTKRIYLKPIPRFLLDAGFWKKHLSQNRPLRECAMGFLLSYAALIEHESDYWIARDVHLLPDEVTWQNWIALVEQLLQSRHFIRINKRFIYGELRLNRLNIIYRFWKGRMRGYLSSSTSYYAFFWDNLNLYITLFAYMSIALAAMQLGLTTRILEGNASFQNMSHAFAIFSLLVPLILIASILVVLAFLFFTNLRLALRYRHQARASVGSEST